jgi:hypothetical protein
MFGGAPGLSKELFTRRVGPPYSYLGKIGSLAITERAAEGVPGYSVSAECRSPRTSDRRALGITLPDAKRGPLPGRIRDKLDCRNVYSTYQVWWLFPTCWINRRGA